MSPAVNVTLEEVPFAILEAVKARILANRQRLERSKPQPSSKPQPQFRNIGANSKEWRRPQYSAGQIGTGYNYGHFWWFMDKEEILNTGYVHNLVVTPTGSLPNGFIASFGNVLATRRTGIKCTSRLFCGDGSKSVQIVHGQASQQMYPASNTSSAVADVFGANYNSFYDVTTLPTGYGAFLLIFAASTANTIITVPSQNAQVSTVNVNSIGAELLTFGKVSQVSVTRRVFVCSNSDIREIAIPAAFSALLDEVHAPTTSEAQVRRFVSVIGSNSIYVTTTAPRFLKFSATGTNGSTVARTPAVFQEITENPFAPAWSGAIGQLVRPIPDDLRWSVQDTSDGAYKPEIYNVSTWRELFNSSQPYNYGTWNTPGEEPQYESGTTAFNPDLFEQDPDATLQLVAGRPTLQAAASISNPGFNAERLYPVWDWNDPAYCRQICLALGFPESDLTP